jgi:hypothetical protein
MAKHILPLHNQCLLSQHSTNPPTGKEYSLNNSLVFNYSNNLTLQNTKFNIVAIFSREAFDKALFTSLLITHIIFLTHLSNRKKSRMVCMTNIGAQSQCYVSISFQTRIYSKIIRQKQCEWAMVRYIKGQISLQLLINYADVEEYNCDGCGMMIMPVVLHKTVFNMTHTQIITMSPSQFVYLCASVH